MTPDLKRIVDRIATSLGLGGNLSLLEDIFTASDRFCMSESNCTLLRADNIDALTYLSNSNNSLIDLCYIDPPYNTKNKFIYNDSRIGGAVDVFGSHSAWMSFMLPRLVIAHSLISDTGFMAVSIDDYEQPYLRLLLDKIFGENNFVGNIVVSRSKNGKGSNKGIAVGHEYIVIYSKSEKAKVLGLSDDESKYDKEDIHGRFKVDGLFRKKGDASKREDRPNMFYPLYYDGVGRVFPKRTHSEQKEVLPIDSKGVERRWLWGRDKVSTEAWKLYASKSGVIYVKNYSSQGKKIKIRSLWDDNKYLTERATSQIKQIYGEKIFETPKPQELIEDIITSLSDKNAIILDFFAGTGTTAHAAHYLNTADGGTRRVILVEQNSKISEGHLAYSYGYKFIADITEARLKYISQHDKNFKYESFLLTDSISSPVASQYGGTLAYG